MHKGVENKIIFSVTNENKYLMSVVTIGNSGLAYTFLKANWISFQTLVYFKHSSRHRNLLGSNTLPSMNSLTHLGTSGFLADIRPITKWSGQLMNKRETFKVFEILPIPVPLPATKILI